MAALTATALLVIAGFVMKIAKTPTVDRSASLTAATHATRHAARHTKRHTARRATASASLTPSLSPSVSPTPSLSPSPSPTPSASPTAQVITDVYSGLSYQQLSAPWQPGCPSVLDTPEFIWTAGENAVAGQTDIDGTVVDWHGVACSGQLTQAFPYGGTGDLEPVTTSVAGALESNFYAGLEDYPALQSSSATQVSGHPAWMVTFLVTYPAAASEGLAWSTEAGAVVVVDRGPNEIPAVFYASVPDDLGTSNVTSLVNSLQLSPG